MNSRSGRLACLTLLLALPGSLPHAREPAAVLDMSLEQLMRLPITASTLTDESLKTVPSAVTVFHHAQIERMGVDYLHELLDYVPGFQQQHSADNAYAFTYSARGRRNSTEAREILLLMDGRVLSDPHTGSGDAAFPLVPLANIERVEVIRGPGSAIYGSSAFTGVINLVSRQEVREAAVTSGSQGLGAANLQWSARPGDWRLDLFANGRRDDGESFNLPDTFGARRVDSRDPVRNHDLDLALRRGETLLRLARHQAEARDFYAVENLANGFNRFRSREEQLELEQSFQPRHGLTLTLSAAYLRTRHDFKLQLTAPGDLLAASLPASADPLRVEGVLASEARELKLDAEQQLTGNDRFRAGLGWRHERDTDTSVANNFDLADLANGAAPIRYYGDFSRRTPIGLRPSRDVLGLYGQWQHDLAAATRLTLGLRFDDYEDAGSRVSPRMGLVHQLDHVHTVKLLYGEAFRAPSLNETGLINNPLLVGNPGLTHETVRTWDLVWLGEWEGFRAGVTLYHNRYDHPLSTALVGSTRTFVNGPSDESKGVELEAGWEPGPAWLVQATITRMASLPDSAFREASLLGSLIVNYDRAAWNLNLSGGYQGQREMLTPGNARLTLDGQWRVQGKLTYRFSPTLEAWLQGKNLPDADIVTPPQGNVLTEPVPGRGREVMAGGVWRF